MNIDFTAVLTQLDDMVNGFLNRLPNIVVGMVALFATYHASKALKTLVRRLSDASGRPENLGIVLGRITRWLTLIFGTLLALVIIFPDFSVGQFVQLLGLGSVAAGIAFREIFEDFFAGILLLINEPYRIGDQIIVDTFEGTIEKIQARTTAIKTYDGRRVIIPNADLFTNTVIVNTAYAHRRIDYDIGIGYQEDVDTARSLILAALHDLDQVVEEPPPEVIVMELGEFSVILRMRWWIRPPHRTAAVDTRNYVLAMVKQRLLEHGIDLPFPTQRVVIYEESNPVEQEA